MMGSGKSKETEEPNSGLTPGAKVEENTVEGSSNMSDLDELSKKIDGAGLSVRELKTAKADKAQVDAAVAELLRLKEEYKTANGGVAFGPPPAPKVEKVKAAPQEKKSEGPSKKELNKMKRKEGRSGGADGQTAESAVVPSASAAVVVTPGPLGPLNLTVFSCAAYPSELSQTVAIMAGVTKVGFENTADLVEPYLVGGGAGSISGDASIARYFARGSASGLNLNQLSAWDASQVDQWLHLYGSAVGANGDAISLLRIVESHLADKTFMVGHSMSLADVAIVLLARKKRGALQSRVHLERWFALVNAKVPMSGKDNKGKKVDIKKVAKADDGKDTNTSGEIHGECPALEGAVEGQVCTRFPPEPSGYLHIGHAKACLLNQYYAQRYKGKMLVRFDDTNPSKEKEEYEENIIQDLATLQVFPDKVSNLFYHVYLVCSCRVYLLSAILLIFIFIIL